MLAGAGPIGAKIPVAVRNVRFEGPVRLVATPLLPSAPGFGALLVSLPTAPRLGLDVRVAGGEITKLPWLYPPRRGPTPRLQPPRHSPIGGSSPMVDRRDEITQAVQGALARDLLWPNRLVLPQSAAPVGLVPSRARAVRAARRWTACAAD